MFAAVDLVVPWCRSTKAAWQPPLPTVVAPGGMTARAGTTAPRGAMPAAESACCGYAVVQRPPFLGARASGRAGAFSGATQIAVTKP
jgi:hypothetical protein